TSTGEHFPSSRASDLLAVVLQPSRVVASVFLLFYRWSSSRFPPLVLSCSVSSILSPQLTPVTLASSNSLSSSAHIHPLSLAINVHTYNTRDLTSPLPHRFLSWIQLLLSSLLGLP
ncbi:hypothetical protein BDN70DRAFT_889075, partial [Pholiota conissans]